MASKANRVMGISPAMDRDWEAEDALSTLMRAEKIKKDEKLMKRVRACAKEKLAVVAEVAGSGTKAKKY
jgi:hypothetical protein